MKKISEKQKLILEYIADFTSEKGYPPSVRDICAGVGLSSPSTVHSHIKKLRENGYLEKEDNKTRALTLKGMNSPSIKVPILGQVTAGMPILAVEQIEGYVSVDLNSRNGEHFALRIKGDSMIGAAILDGDIIVIRKQETARSGQIVVALIEDEATCKTLKLDGRNIWLMAENPNYSPIDGNECIILGVVVAVHREILA